MSRWASRHLADLASYPFARIDARVTELRAKGVEVTDFGVGDPSYPTPEFIREACARGLDTHASSGYPSYVGSMKYREAVAAWFDRRFGIPLDPDQEIAATIGSKEAVFNFPLAVIDPGDLVLVPNPGYPPYQTGTRFAGGVPVEYPVDPAADFLPDLDAIPEDIARRAKLMWINSPHSPTGRQASLSDLQRIVAWAREHDIIVASDEAYSEIYMGAPPPSALELGKEGILVFQSLSKRSAMTGYRVGFVCGDPELVALYKKLKTNIDSGVPSFIQDAAIKALSDEDHVREARETYARKMKRVLATMDTVGLTCRQPEATIYLWQQVPDGMDDVAFAERLLDERIGIVVIPGSWLARSIEGKNPGSGFVRWALTPSEEQVDRAMQRLEKSLTRTAM